jgi:fumarate reductase subunit D
MPASMLARLGQLATILVFAFGVAVVVIGVMGASDEACPAKRGMTVWTICSGVVTALYIVITMRVGTWADEARTKRGDKVLKSRRGAQHDFYGYAYIFSTLSTFMTSTCMESARLYGCPVSKYLPCQGYILLVRYIAVGSFPSGRTMAQGSPFLACFARKYFDLLLNLQLLVPRDLPDLFTEF